MQDDLEYDDSVPGLSPERDPLAQVEAVIKDRRSVKRFLDRPVPRALLARLIETSVWAPNHRLNEPWRFYILDGASRQRLGDVAGEVTRAKMAAAGTPQAAIERKAADAAAGWASVPALIYVTVRSDPDPEMDLENYGAACCAVQNLMLAAHAAGLGTSWSSGVVAASSGLHELAGAAADERMVALLRVGYPDTYGPPPVSRRESGASHTTWLDGE